MATDTKKLRQAVSIGNRTYRPGEEGELEKAMSSEQYEYLKTQGVFTTAGDELEPIGAGDGDRGTTVVDPSASEAPNQGRTGVNPNAGVQTDLTGVKIADLEAEVAKLSTADQVIAAKQKDGRAGAQKIYDARLEALAPQE